MSAIYEAIPAILAEVEAIGKTHKNAQQGYNFRGIDDVYRAVHPLLAKHKVFPVCEIVSRELTERETRNGSVLFYVNLKARYTLYASDGSNVTTEAWGEAMDSGDKATNKAMSAAYKYALFQLLCIPTEAVDSEQDSHQDIAPKRTDVKPLPAKPKRDEKPTAKQVAQQHGMKTADELAQPSETYKQGIASIEQAIRSHNKSHLAAIGKWATKCKQDGFLTESEDAALLNQLQLAEKQIDAVLNQEAAA